MQQTTRTLGEEFAEHVNAGFPALYVQTEEPDEALRELATAAASKGWAFARWDCDSGLEEDGSSTDPVAALRAGATIAADGGASHTVLAMRNLHQFMKSPDAIQAIETAARVGKSAGLHVVALAPVVDIPPELARTFAVLTHGLPTRDQVERIAEEIAGPDRMPGPGPDREAILDAATGLTRHEAENAFALSIVRHDRLAPAELWDLKTAALRKSGLLTLDRTGDGFDKVGGLEALKRFALRALRPDRPRHVNPRGLLLVGVPGTGKSAIARAIGTETGRPTLTLDIGALMGSLVGQTEANVRRALATADAMAPCVLFADEIEKALSGSGGGSNDGGVSRRLFGTLLTWLNDHASDVFFVGTANDVSALPPEFARAERFDAIYMIDAPGPAERAAIWRMYLARYELDRDQPTPDDSGWTGAEIKACCRLAALLDVPLAEAARNVVPVTRTAAESIEKLRRWADSRALDANRPGAYRHAEGQGGQAVNGHAAKAAPTKRRITRDASEN